MVQATISYLAGPSNADSSEFHSVLPRVATSRDPSYYSNIEPDFQWIRTAIRHLINLVSSHFDEFYDKTLKKKVLWKKIAEEMRAGGFNCTADECDKKWRNMKKSYVSVLQKQVQGDFSSKFPYFDHMHAFLGKEIDPLGMREQGLNKAIQEKTMPDSVEFPRIPFYEVTEDDNFEWTSSAVHLLLDLILEHGEIFKVNSDIDSVWESITDKMTLDGYVVLPEQCQRKWVNLSEGFRHYQAEAEVSGLPPKWLFFSRVRHVINTVNVPVTLAKDVKPNLASMKGSLSMPALVRDVPRRRKRRREMIERIYVSDMEDEEEEIDFVDAKSRVSPALNEALRTLDRNMNVEKRLSHLESRIEVAQKQKAAAKRSNNLLELILSELKRINRSFEDKSNKERNRLKHLRMVHHELEEDDDDDAEEEEEEEDDEDEDEELTPIVDEATCHQALLNMQNITNFHLMEMKTPKVELVEGDETDGIIIVEGL